MSRARRTPLPCETVVASLHEYVDEELPAAIAAEVRAHLERCASCRRRLEHERAFHRALRRCARADAAPERLRTRLRLALRVRERLMAARLSSE
jgi:mycothiol system anti-sigma-R factor